MADKTADDDLELKPADAGAMFRVEMFTTNVLLGYWKYFVGAVVIILISILVYGQWNDYTRRTQRAATASIAEKLGELPAELPLLSESLANGETLDLPKIEAVGHDLVAIANGASGPARIEALLSAAELFRVAGKPDDQRSALNTAAAEGSGILGYAANGGLANLELAQNEGDAAVARLKALSQSQKGYLAEQATIDLGLALEHLGRKDEASAVYAEFMTRFPDSPRAEQVKMRQDRVAGAAPIPAPADGAPAPADGTVPAAPGEAAPPAEGAPAQTPAEGGGG
ncbi:MAG: tetratricopeptide repeat protein [Myxococcota bacterium]